MSTALRIDRRENLIQLLRSCKNLTDARRAHTRIFEELGDRAATDDVFLANSLVQSYGRCGSAEDSRWVFDATRAKNAHSWVSMLAAYAHNGHLDEAKRFFAAMPDKNRSDPVACNILIGVHSQCGEIGEAKRLFDQAPDRTVVSYNTLIQAFARSGHLIYAKWMFHSMPERSIVSWNSIISACGEHGLVQETKEIFDRAPQRNVISWNAMIQAYSSSGHLGDASALFQTMRERSVISWTVMIVGYAHSGELESASAAFDRMPERGVAAWNAIISAHGQSKNLTAAERLFDSMPERSTVSWNAMLQLLADSGEIDRAKELFARVPRRDVISWNTAVKLHAELGDVDGAMGLFHKMPQWNSISWNILFHACGSVEESKHLYDTMPVHGIESWTTMLSTSVSETTILTVLAHNGHLSAARECFHSMAETTIVAQTAMLAAYAQNGHVKEAKELFDSMPRTSFVSWNAMVTAYAQNGHPREALELFHSMVLHGERPDEMTFSSILLASSHNGMADRGWSYFASMVPDYCVRPVRDHFYCMVDAFGRAGRLAEAMELAERMPFEADVVVWRSLLGACRTSRDVETGAFVAHKLFEADPGDSVAYTILAGMYATAGMKDEEAKVMKLMEQNCDNKNHQVSQPPLLE
ncbi:hypothetical protein SELMODRAFT_81279 [Selaginella moellendorffii]|uniref:Pentacotripeptide-repeat region of PRORP domain-containing protein n=1 Tax=Selaginella moellendorffii TaxID=88036 RepID=D8QYV8_SELML|nr:hypothetical protein SELMODRAFT_81279 [Selaginella moellendorffii]